MQINYGFLLLALALTVPKAGADPYDLNPIEALGRQIFFDQNLSDPPGQSCASCHNPASGWTGDTSEINAHEAVYHGAVGVRSGNRKPPSAAYATQSPIFHYDQEEGLFIGGNFWDGRATGWLLGDPAAEQAQGPFLNPLEQNVASAERVVDLVCKADYGDQFRAIYGRDICDNNINAYNAIGKALSAFEGSAEVNAFTSKYDYYLKDAARYPLTRQELLGLQLYENPGKGNCAACHPNRPGADGSPPLFTDYTFDNLGMPKNPENSWYQMPRSINPQGEDWIDPGLAGFLGKVPRFAEYAAENRGKHKVPTLRNVDKRPSADFIKAFGHNGYFKSLEGIVHFYNTRDVLPSCAERSLPQAGKNCWPAPEVRENMNTEELGRLGLSEEEEGAIVAFMKALTDGWRPPSE